MLVKSQPTYFVYVHRRKDSGEVFYVGKGTRTPLKQYIRSTTTVRRNIIWKRIVAKHGYVVEVLVDFFNEIDAFAFERELIARYGRLMDGGTLCNLTNGGEGHCGLSPSEETRRKMSERAKGKHRTPEQRLAVSLAQRGVPNPIEQNIRHSQRMSGTGNYWWGRSPSSETLKKRSLSMMGKLVGDKHPSYGKKRSPDIVARYSGGNAGGARKVVDVETGRIFDCMKHAAQFVGRAESTMHRWLTGVRHNPTSMRFYDGISVS